MVKKTFCFCGKAKSPTVTTNHCCGGICDSVLPCKHSCLEICHPGQCQDCQLVSMPIPCECGKKVITLPCKETNTDSFRPNCGSGCLEMLNCGVHYCSQGCHAPPCGECKEMTESSCVWQVFFNYFNNTQIVENKPRLSNADRWNPKLMYFANHNVYNHTPAMNTNVWKSVMYTTLMNCALLIHHWFLLVLVALPL